MSFFGDSKNMNHKKWNETILWMDEFQKHKNFGWVFIRMLNWMGKKTGKRWKIDEKLVIFPTNGKIAGKIDGQLDRELNRKINEYTR